MFGITAMSLTRLYGSMMPQSCHSPAWFVGSVGCEHNSQASAFAHLLRLELMMQPFYDPGPCHIIRIRVIDMACQS
jgi:hypothetical protein